MSNRKQREQNRANARALAQLTAPLFECANCKELVRSGHFVPPSFGEEGYYICDEKKDEEQH